MAMYGPASTQRLMIHKQRRNTLDDHYIGGSAMYDTARMRIGQLRLASAEPQMVGALEERRKDGMVEHALAIELHSGCSRDEDEDGGTESGPPAKKRRKTESLEEAVERLLPTNPEPGKAFKAAQRSLNNVFAATGERLDLHQLTATRLSKLQLEYPKKRDVAAAPPSTLPSVLAVRLWKPRRRSQDKGTSAQKSKARVADRDRRRANGVRAQISIDDVRAAQKQLEEQEVRSAPSLPRSLVAEVKQRHAERLAVAAASTAATASMLDDSDEFVDEDDGDGWRLRRG